MIRIRWMFATLVLSALALLPSSGQSQELSMMWEFTPKPGVSTAAVEAAIKAHMEFRADLGDPWQWGWAQVAVGDNVGTYYAISEGHSFADIGAYNDHQVNVAGGAHFDATVAPLMASMKNVISEMDLELSNVPAEPMEFRVYQVSTIYLKPEGEAAATEAIATVRQVVQDAGAPMYYVISRSVVGGQGPAITMVGLSEDWAGLAEPDTTLDQMLVDALGEEAAMELYMSWASSFHYVESEVVVARPDLSSGGM